MQLALNCITALTVTLAIEIPVAVLLGYRKNREIAAVILVNVITNPPLNYLIYLNYYFDWMPYTTFAVICLEVAVVLVEWRLLLFALRKSSSRMLLLSAAMNATSYVVGAIIF
jgi:hypothetical protein